MDFKQQLETGCAHLRQRDPIFGPLIDRYGLPTITPHSDYYQTLVESIISQQLSVKAAATIRRRFIDLYDHFPAPSEVLNTDIDQLRSVGLSGRKTSYIQDLAYKVEDGIVRFEHLDNLDNQQIISQLTEVKGIGQWTVHMFLMFCMGRLNVLATGDLGIRQAVSQNYRLGSIASPDEVTDIAERNSWSPYQTIACWYMWRSLENKPSID